MKSFSGRNLNLSVALGVLSVILGVAYLVNYPPVTGDARWATVPWGLVMVVTGCFILVSAIRRQQHHGTINTILIMLFMVNFVLQIPAVILWFIFHGQVVGEYKAMPTVTGHWLWAGPHLILAMLAVISVCNRVFR